ncbi:MAG: MBL fold metallo-hydrolase [Inhella sp.]
MEFPSLEGIRVFERGWLSSNQVLIPAAAGESGALLIDSGHGLHSEQTVSLLRAELQGQGLRAVLNTHLHSDHCGGNARLQRAFGAEVWVPEGEAALARHWEEAALSHALSGQYLPRFKVQRSVAAGEIVEAGGLVWELLAAPGHDPHALMLFERERGLLISGDALWERGHAVVFPELVGESGFEEALWTLETIEHLPVRCVVPGHGRAFEDVATSLRHARECLIRWQRDPFMHARHALRVLVKYHLMEVGREPLAATLIWAAGVPLLRRMWERFAPVGVASPASWCEQVLGELLGRGLARRLGDEVLDTA